MKIHNAGDQIQEQTSETDAPLYQTKKSGSSLRRPSTLRPQDQKPRIVILVVSQWDSVYLFSLSYSLCPSPKTLATVFSETGFFHAGHL